MIRGTMRSEIKKNMHLGQTGIKGRLGERLNIRGTMRTETHDPWHHEVRDKEEHVPGTNRDQRTPG